ncbi:DUF2339 domain-containing protein [Aggregatibacter actinomycetemcomitans]|uniref:DUF2339 domain-containing protein n=1 Tax=Aggregatibacter actinomycetemcomitans TaxID=714 RepID=UPI00197C1502|nr:DUF2339 domain-containing protein [Aggregatibacter actinomycetemcomitans]MBN6076805.1 DUF2339 domain-containing protein [Aggregatibacter actinomycetemcomitans]
MDEILLLILVTFVIFIIMAIDACDKIKFRIKQLETQAESWAKEIAQLRAHIELLERQSVPPPLIEEIAEQAVNIEAPEEAPEPITVTHALQEDIMEAPEIALSSEASTPEYTEEMQEQPPSVEIPKPAETPKPPVFEEEVFSHHTAKPQQPNPIWQWLFKGNPILKVGAVILFLGLSFLLRFASEHISFSIEARYASVAVTGVICSLIGWRLRNTRREYGLTLQGLGIGVLYLTSLATFKLHQLLPVWLVFLFQVILVVIMVALALLQNARILAQVALIGGLASPVLLSDGSGNYLVLFSYLALLNTSIAVVAWFKSWRSLNLIGFIGSTILVAGWGAQHYQPSLYLVCQLFLAYYLALYTFIVWRFATLQSAESEALSAQYNNATLAQLMHHWLNGVKQIGVLDSGLLVGSAISAFIMQYDITDHFADGIFYSGLGFALFYGICGIVIRHNVKLHIVTHAMFALSLVFFTIGLSDAFTEQWQTFTLWSLEAALIYAFGIYQKSPVARLTALLFFIPVSLFTHVFFDHNLSNSFSVISLGFAMAIAWQRYRSGVSALWEKTAVGTIFAISLFALAFKPLQMHELGYSSAFAAVMLTATLAVICAAIQWRWLNRLLTTSATVILFIDFLPLMVFSFEGNAVTWLCVLLGLMSWFIGWSTANPKYHHTNFANAAALLGLTNVIAGGFLFFSALTDVPFLDEALIIARNIIILFVLFSLFAKITRWQAINTLQLAYLPLFTLVSIGFYCAPESPVTQENVYDWLLILFAACALHYLMLWQQRNMPEVLHGKLKTYWHISGLNVFMINFIVFCMKWAYFVELTDAWFMLSFAMVPLAVTGILMACRSYLIQRNLENIYLQQGILPTLLFLAAWLVFGNIISDGTSAPLPYLPVFNPLELTSLAAVYLLWRWQQIYIPAQYKTRALAAMAGVGLFMVSVIVMRVWHHYADIEWKLATLLASFGLQATLSVIWTMCAILLMVKGNKSGQQPVWFSGAALISLVVIKLFLVELGNSGGVARIVSFIVVGLLLLIVGYFAPLPPKNKVTTADNP